MNTRGLPSLEGLLSRVLECHMGRSYEQLIVNQQESDRFDRFLENVMEYCESAPFQLVKNWCIRGDHSVLYSKILRFSTYKSWRTNLECMQEYNTYVNRCAEDISKHMEVENKLETLGKKFLQYEDASRDWIDRHVMDYTPLSMCIVVGVNPFNTSPDGHALLLVLYKEEGIWKAVLKDCLSFDDESHCMRSIVYDVLKMVNVKRVMLVPLLSERVGRLSDCLKEAYVGVGQIFDGLHPSQWIEKPSYNDNNLLSTESKSVLYDVLWRDSVINVKKKQARLKRERRAKRKARNINECNETPYQRHSTRKQKKTQFIVWVLGGPGSGKETLSKLLEGHFSRDDKKLVRLGVEDLLQKPLDLNTPLANEIRAAMESKGVVNPEIELQLLENAMMDVWNNCNGYIIDGNPRNVSQAELFAQKLGTPDLIIILKHPDNVLLSRLKQRGQASENHEALKEKLKTFQSTLQAIQERWKEAVVKVDGTMSQGKVFKKCQNIIKEFMNN